MLSLLLCAITVALIWLVGGGCAQDGGSRLPSWVREPDPARQIVEAVRARLPSLKPGMTQEQVHRALVGLPFGKSTIVSMTISGGQTVSYEIAEGHHLVLTFIPHGNQGQPGRLTEATLTEYIRRSARFGYLGRTPTGTRFARRSMARRSHYRTGGSPVLRSIVVTIMAAAVACMQLGCGTCFNLQSAGPAGRGTLFTPNATEARRVYGGVLCDAENLGQAIRGPQRPLTVPIVLLIGLDLPLSALADTLTTTRQPLRSSSASPAA